MEKIKIKVNACQLREYEQIKGLFLMGSRAENDYQKNFSDIDCCVVVSQPVDYRELYEMVSRVILETPKLEVCPRSILQLKIKNKFNYDLKYLSKIIYIRDLDVRSEIPPITLADFSRKDICSTLFSALEFFVAALYECFKKTDKLSIVSLLEKSLRKLSLYINLRHSLYPVHKTNRYRILNMLYFEQSLGFTELSLFRQTLNYHRVNLSSSILALIHIINCELHIISDSPTIDTNFLAVALTDKEHVSFAQSLLEIFLKICENTLCTENPEDIFTKNRIEVYLLNDYHSLIAQDTFSPPTIIKGGYHVFK